jgi:8-oxo-dGTP pyrophosphatase MutT (NUDIX family)
MKLLNSSNNDRLNFKPHLCRNCGHIGHIYKNCPHPIMSFGIICYKIENDEIKFLMIQRKDSLSFMEFMRGKYEITNLDYIKQLLMNMTINERNMIINLPFDEIWNYLWHQNENNINKNNKEFFESKYKFTSLNDSNFLKNYILSIKSIFNEQEWGFPKGRRKIKESDLDCAVREFYEETRIINNDIIVIYDILPFEEIFFGTNGIMYKHVYFVAKIKNNKINIKIDNNCLEQVREIRAIKWYNYNDVLLHIKCYNTERISLFKYANSKIREYENKSS